MATQKKVTKTNTEWRSILNDESYRVTREKGTETPFQNLYHEVKTNGTYHCICCDTALFHSSNKFDSGSGWPSFSQPLNPAVVAEHADRSISFMTRTEVTCDICDAHLGHVFNDGPESTGLRYCINSASLKLKP